MFYLEEEMMGKSIDLVYKVICSAHNKDYFRDNREGKTRTRDRVHVFQHIYQAQKRNLKCEEIFRICGKGLFKKFPFIKLHLNNKRTI